MKRILSLMLVLPLAAYAATACSSKGSDSSSTGNTGTGGNGGTGGTGGGDGTGPSSPSDVPKEDLEKNPIEGIAPAKAVFESGAYTDGPVWHQKMGVLFFSTPLGEGALFKMLPDGRAMKVRDGKKADGTTPIGNTISAAGEIITVEMKRITRTAFDDKNVPQPPVVIADSYPVSAAPAPAPAPGPAPAPAPAPDPNAPAPSTPGKFDTLKEITAKKDGTLFVTDPGYFTNPQANRIYRVGKDAKVEVVEAFEDVPRPTGIALSPDEKYLYVVFSIPVKGTLPFVRQYIVNDDGTLGEWTKFLDIGPEDSKPDGLAVDLAGNVYVATKAGIEVYKSDSSKIGVIPIPEKPTGVSFGGKDMKSLYVTTEGVKIWELRLNVPGISQ